MSILILYHNGSTIPNYLKDCIIQFRLFNKNATIYLIISDNLILNLHIENITAVPISILPENLEFNAIYSKDNVEFRDGFWKHTLERFFYIKSLMALFKLKHVFHIENDVLLYSNLQDIPLHENKLNVVQDSPFRVIPSIVFIPNLKEITNFCDYIIKELHINSNANDMNILGKYPVKSIFHDDNLIFDGAAIGQYLGGVDPRNTSGNTVGFINETADLKCDQHTITKMMNINGLYYWTLDGKKIVNLHIHSKNLKKFRSDIIPKQQIISGERIQSKCDLVLATSDICNFHENIDTYSKDILEIRDLKNFNKEVVVETLNDCKRVFIYTHLLEFFQESLLDFITTPLEIVCHNSDHVFDETFRKILDNKYITKVYAQNLNIIDSKCKLIPIGVANAMWKHGNINSVAQVTKTMSVDKPKLIYINVNPNTFDYRKIVLKHCQSQFKSICFGNLQFKDYLEELSKYKFSLCIRGNGIDTHRFWESLYLHVIPIIINNSETNCDGFVENLRKLNVPFLEIKNLSDLNKKTCENFYSTFNSNQFYENNINLDLDYILN